MIYLRNRLAEYEVNVARYYVKRGAYLAAAQRAQGVIEQYDGAPAERRRVAMLLECYQTPGLHRPGRQRASASTRPTTPATRANAVSPRPPLVGVLARHRR